MKYNKGFAPIALLLIVLGIAAVGGAAYFAGKSAASKKEVNMNLAPSQVVQQNTLDTSPRVDREQVGQATQSKTIGCGSAPSIIVLSPNGGETYNPGQYIPIKWTSCNIPNTEKVRIDLLIPPFSPNSTNGTSLANTLNDGNETVALPPTSAFGAYPLIIGRDYKISIWSGNASDLSDNTFTIEQPVVNLSSFSSKYIGVYPTDTWPPVIQHDQTRYSCSTMTRDVFGTPTTLSGTEKNMNGKTVCKYEFSDVGAGHHAGVYTYTVPEFNGAGTKRVDFRVDWPSCGGYGGAGDPQYDQCNKDQTFFFNNLDLYIANLI